MPGTRPPASAGNAGTIATTVETTSTAETARRRPRQGHPTRTPPPRSHFTDPWSHHMRDEGLLWEVVGRDHPALSRYPENGSTDVRPRADPPAPGRPPTHTTPDVRNRRNPRAPA